MYKPSSLMQAKPSHLSAQEQTRKQPPSHTAIQPRIAAPARSQKQPAAPAAYSPQPAPRVLQLKTRPRAGETDIRTTNKRPVAPAVYRSQPTPKCLQLKGAMKQQPPASQAAPTHVAPTVYHPQPVPKVLQTRVPTCPQTHRAATVQPKMAGSQTGRLPVAPPVNLPKSLAAVLQTRIPAGQETARPSGRQPGNPISKALQMTGPAASVKPVGRASNTNLNHLGAKRDSKIIQPLIYQLFPGFDEIQERGIAKIHKDKLEWGPFAKGVGEIKNQIGQYETLVLSAHGWGATISPTENYPERTTDSFPKSGKEGWFPATLAEHLHNNVLPQNYRGEIIMWVCFSAYNWKHLGGDDTTFIDELRKKLVELGHRPRVKGFPGRIRTSEGINSNHLNRNKPTEPVNPYYPVPWEQAIVTANEPEEKEKFWFQDDKIIEDMVQGRMELKPTQSYINKMNKLEEWSKVRQQKGNF